MLAWVSLDLRELPFDRIQFYLLRSNNMLLYVCTVMGWRIKRCLGAIVKQGTSSYEVHQQWRVKVGVNHIESYQIYPLFGSLKTYAGRLHAYKDSRSFHSIPGAILTGQVTIVRWYCVNDTLNTQLLRRMSAWITQLPFTGLSNEFTIDLRSKSDAQIAEAVINRELKRLTGRFPSKPFVESGLDYRLPVPYYLNFQSGQSDYAGRYLRMPSLFVGHTGSVRIPQGSRTSYWLWIVLCTAWDRRFYTDSGTTAAHVADWWISIIWFWYVTSYYPRIILNLGLAPQHLGDSSPTFIAPLLVAVMNQNGRNKDVPVHGGRYHRTFGKLGNMFSIIYSPVLLFQVTLTGLATLLLLGRTGWDLLASVWLSQTQISIMVKLPSHAQSYNGTYCRMDSICQNRIRFQTLFP